MEAISRRKRAHRTASDCDDTRRGRVDFGLRQAIADQGYEIIAAMKTLLLFTVATLFAQAQVLPLNPSGVSMGHLHIVTPDPDAHRKLWIDVLGGKSVKAGPIEFAMFPGVLVAFRTGEASGGTV